MLAPGPPMQRRRPSREPSGCASYSNLELTSANLVYTCGRRRPFFLTPTCPPTFWNHALPTLPRCTQCRAPRFRQVLCEFSVPGLAIETGDTWLLSCASQPPLPAATGRERCAGRRTAVRVSASVTAEKATLDITKVKPHVRFVHDHAPTQGRLLFRRNAVLGCRQLCATVLSKAELKLQAN